jgi:Zn-dependent protease
LSFLISYRNPLEGICREKNLEETIQKVAIWAIPVLIAVVFHEVAHGWVANRLGDPTAARLGRLTLNPIAHIDLFGTILFPALLILSGSPFVFGYAKPVPVNFYNLRNPKRDMVWVAAAGPAMNLLLALGFVLAWKALMPQGGSGLSDGSWLTPLVLMAQGGLLINISLAVFNMFPLPPLDGGRVLVGLLPDPLSSKVAGVERYGFLILIVLLMTRTVDRIIDPPMEFLLRVYLGIF